MFDFSKSVFSGQDLNVKIPKDIEVVFVSDFFVEDLIGGAELTSEAIIKKSPYKLLKLKARDCSPELILENKDKYWIIGNFATINPASLAVLMETSGIKYSIIEYDYKYCVYRSAYRHFVQTKTPCNCLDTEHGQMMNKFFLGAQKLFWMAEKQKNQYLNLMPNLNVEGKNIIQSSTFDDTTFDQLKWLRISSKKSQEKQDKVYMIQQSDSWIKGTSDTINWAKTKGMNYRLLGNVQYNEFLGELAKCYGFIFRPLSEDTCSRAVLESKLLGLELELNQNVIHRTEEWFNSSIEECEKYLRGRADFFWTNILL